MVSFTLQPLYTRGKIDIRCQGGSVDLSVCLHGEVNSNFSCRESNPVIQHTASHYAGWSSWFIACLKYDTIRRFSITNYICSWIWYQCWSRNEETSFSSYGMGSAWTDTVVTASHVHYSRETLLYTGGFKTNGCVLWGCWRENLEQRIVVVLIIHVDVCRFTI
jgi:hypothetical protein